MVVTICGSYSRKEDMLSCKKYFEQLGNVVNCPFDPKREKEPLIMKQYEWIQKIEEADLIVVVPKETNIEVNGGSRYVYEFGESTSYEMAMAVRFDKAITIWT